MHLLLLFSCMALLGVVVTSPEDLKSMVEEAVASALLRALPTAVERATSKPYLTKKELMKLTGWSSRQVEYKKSNRQIPFIRRGRLVLFPTKEVHAYLEEGRVPTKEQ